VETFTEYYIYSKIVDLRMVLMNNKIIRKRVSQLKPGMVLGNDIFSDSGAVLLVRDTVLTDYIVGKLRDWLIVDVDVVAGESRDEPEIKPAREYSEEDRAFFDMYTHSVESIGILFQEMATGNKIPLREFQPIAEEILDQVLGVQGVLNRLRQVKSGDEYTFNHSMNVGIYSVLIGKWLNYDEGVLRLLAMAGLLHDAGKAKIPAVIIKKPGPLIADEWSEIQRHPLYGFQIVANTAGIPGRIATIVLQHHERENGTGYPLKLSGGNIDELAKIVAVADVYDAMTSDRVYQTKRTPYAAADIIMEEGFQTLDPVIVQTFLANITSLFSLDKIRLNDGRIGTIICVNRQHPTRPLIQTDQGFIDLEKTPQLHIVDVIS
jgi:HD-GYP domain-containing protein (c-di-GMP phosphodiesterase class II)